MSRSPITAEDHDRMSTGRSDEELVRAAGAGDMDALGELYVRHHRQVYELCFRMVGDPDAAEDLTHESFLRVKRYGASFDGRSAVSSWLYRLVRNRCLDWLDARGRERTRSTTLAAHLDVELEGEPVEDGRRELVRIALERLPPDMREVIVLSRFGDLRYREIAEACGISVGNVKVRAHRAMNELRRIFSELEANHEL